MGREDESTSTFPDVGKWSMLSAPRLYKITLYNDIKKNNLCVDPFAFQVTSSNTKKKKKKKKKSYFPQSKN